MLENKVVEQGSRRGVDSSGVTAPFVAHSPNELAGAEQSPQSFYLTSFPSEPDCLALNSRFSQGLSTFLLLPLAT